MNNFNFDEINEMEMFNIKRRDIISFKEFSKSYDNVTKITKPGDKKAVLKPWIHEIKRLDMFSHEAFDPTYDMLDKAKGKKPSSETNRANGLLYTQSPPQS